MKNLHRTMLMAAVATFVASGAYAAGDYDQNEEASQMNNQNQQRMNNEQRMGNQQQMNAQQSVTLSNADVMDVQESLNDEGFNIAVDGIWGPQTTAAIRSFQNRNDLDTTGDLNSETLAELEVDIDGSRDMW